jgi:hypothetical protein
MTHEIDYLETRYSFTSSTYELEANRYITQYNVDIYAHPLTDDFEEPEPLLIGKAKLTLLLLGLAMENNFDYYCIFDSSRVLCDLGSEIYDWVERVLKPEFDEFAIDSFNSNILYLERIEILPEYTNNGWGKKVIKDILCRLDNCFGVLILKSYPLQFEGIESEFKSDDEWIKLMKYEAMELDEKIATKRLNDFYKSLGFKKLFKDNYFFYNSGHKNKKLDKINIDE